MRIAITQRVDVVSSYKERRDALDQAWLPTLERIFSCAVILQALPNSPSHVSAYIENMRPHLIILSGGNSIGTCSERDDTENHLLNMASNLNIPVLGVCRGMQMIQIYLGGGLTRLDSHVSKIHSITSIETRDSILSNSYHEYGVMQNELANELQALFYHQDNSVEACIHPSKLWLGVMWHPERPGNDFLLDSWLAKNVLEMIP